MEHIDIAQVLSLRAGRHLGEAYSLYKELKSDKHTPQEVEIIHRLEAESCIEAIILFQTAMEAVINEEIEYNKHLFEVKKERDLRLKRYRNLSFKNRWMKSYDALGLDPTIGVLADYFEFYNEYRVSITHPASRYVNLEKYNFENIYEGIKSGWYAIELLYEKIGKSNKDFTWESYCKKSDLPSSI